MFIFLSLTVHFQISKLQTTMKHKRLYFLLSLLHNKIPIINKESRLANSNVIPNTAINNGIIIDISFIPFINPIMNETTMKTNG